MRDIALFLFGAGSLGLCQWIWHYWLRDWINRQLRP